MVEISQSRVDDVRWVLATCSRHQARARAASDSSTHRWTLRVAAAALLPITHTQCAASGHPAERCVCWRAGEDWYERCAPGAAGSVAAWRVEPRAAVRCWRALQDLAARVVERRARPVLWGGRVRRPATRLERTLGYRGFVVLGDRWLRPGMGKIRWCATCGCHTPHTPSRGRWFCDVTTHDLAPDRRAA